LSVFVTIFGAQAADKNVCPTFMHSEKVTWGGLTSYVVHDLAAGERPSRAVVLCHGYGAPGTDLVKLAQPLLATAADQARQKAVLIFPGAPLDLAGQGIPGGRAWWHIDLDRLINRRTPELLAQFRHACPVGLPEARDQLVALLGEAGKHFDLTADRFILGGFSQGAMLATDVALRLKKPPAGLCVLSGALVNEDQWRPLALERGPLTVLQSHGRHDSILPFPMAAALRDLLLESGAEVDFLAFEGDHEIPLEVMHRMVHFIRELSSS
jgi:phospholipase/carboxylesterase